MFLWRGMIVCWVAGLMTGCASLVAPTYAPDYDALDALKKTQPGTVAVAEVQPRDPKARVNSITLRGSTLRAPRDTFAAYFEDALIRDLKEIAAFDTQSGTRVEATLLENDINVAGISTGSGTMKVALRVKRGEQLRLEKTYAVATSFESSFMGGVAIPKGQAAYQTLVKTMLAAIYRDAEFVKAIGK